MVRFWLRPSWRAQFLLCIGLSPDTTSMSRWGLSSHLDEDQVIIFKVQSRIQEGVNLTELRYLVRQNRGSPTKPKFSILSFKKEKNGPSFILCMSLLYVFLKPQQQFFFKFAFPFRNEPTFSRDNMRIFKQNSKYIYWK